MDQLVKSFNQLPDLGGYAMQMTRKSGETWTHCQYCPPLESLPSKSAEVEAMAQYDEDSLFRLYSMTKALTAVLVAKLVEAGKIHWDTPLSTLGWNPQVVKESHLLQLCQWDKGSKSSVDLGEPLYFTRGEAQLIYEPRDQCFKLSKSPKHGAKFSGQFKIVGEESDRWILELTSCKSPSCKGPIIIIDVACHQILMPKALHYQDETFQLEFIDKQGNIYGLAPERHSQGPDTKLNFVPEVKSRLHTHCEFQARRMRQTFELEPLSEAKLPRKFVLLADREAVEQEEVPVLRIRHLMTHTSGWTYGCYPFTDSYRDVIEKEYYVPLQQMANAGCSLQEWLDAFKKIPLSFYPGTKRRYSFGFDVLSGILAEHFGEPFDSLLNRHVLAPLSLNLQFVVAPQEAHRLVRYWVETHNGLEPFKEPGWGYVEADHCSAFSGGGGIETDRGGLVGTLAEYSKFLKHIYWGNFLEPSTLSTLLEPQIILTPQAVVYHLLGKEVKVKGSWEGGGSADTLFLCQEDSIVVIMRQVLGSSKGGQMKKILREFP